MPRLRKTKRRQNKKRQTNKKRIRGGNPDEIDVVEFVKKLHGWLKTNEMCFLSGAYVFEDPEHRFYNIFAHGKDTEKCQKNQPLSDNVKEHNTTTHANYEKPPYSIETNCGRAEKYTFKQSYKLERNLGELNFLCGDEEGHSENKETKRVALFYPFITGKESGKPTSYLYLKFEEHPMNSLSHVGTLLSQARHNTFPMRREGTKYRKQYVEQYVESLDKKFYVESLDKEFYKKIGASIDKLDEYNRTMRSGSELFLSKEALDVFMNLNPPVPLINMDY